MLAPAILILCAAAVPDDAVLRTQEGPLAKVLQAAMEQSRPVMLDLYADW